jgi:CO/xanthine dehydrogenase FAD-binding subunit
VFILEHYFTSKLFAAVHEACSKVYPEKVPNKATCGCSACEYTVFAHAQLAFAAA